MLMTVQFCPCLYCRMQSNAEQLHLELEPLWYLRSAAAVMQTSNSPALAADLWNTMTPSAKEARAQQQVFRRHEYGRTASPSVTQTMLTMSKLGSIKEVPPDMKQALFQPVHPVLASVNGPAIAQPLTAVLGRRCCWRCIADSPIRQQGCQLLTPCLCRP